MEVQELIDSLRKEGVRITKVRAALLTFFAESRGPASAAEIGSHLKSQGLPVNKTTVYRELDFLLIKKLVREVDLLDGTKRYEVTKPNDHHHHLVCTECRTVQCVSMANDLDSLEHRINKQYRFKIASHILEFFGVCDRCQGASA